MRAFLIPAINIVFIVLALPDPSRADLLTFDDGNLGPFSYTNFSVMEDPCATGLAGTGFCRGVVSTPNVGSSSDPTEPFTMTYTGQGTFTFDSVYVTSPFSQNTSTTVTINGYLNGVLEDNSVVTVHPSGAPVYFVADWSGINELTFSPPCVLIGCSGEEGVVVDNLAFAPDAPGAPEPATGTLLAVGSMLAAAGILLRRRYFN